MVLGITNSVNSAGTVKLPVGTNNIQFRGNSNSLKQLEADTIEISNKPKKKKLSKGAKWAIGIGGAIVATAGAIVFRAKIKASHLQKLYKEKLILSNLPEKIDFKEAKTVEEGIRFAKEVLKIKEVSPDFTLDAINFANKGIVDVANANKGKCFLPTKLCFKNMEDDTIAGTYKVIQSKDFGRMTINKKYFDENFLTKILTEEIPGMSKTSKVSKELDKIVEKEIQKKGYSHQDLLCIQWDENFKDLVRRFKENPNNLTVSEKRDLWRIYHATDKTFQEKWNIYPKYFLERNKKLFEEQGIKYNIDEIGKMSTKEQSEKMFELLKEHYEKTGKAIAMKSVDNSPYNTIYHEMGHLQDYAKNLKELDVNRLYFWKKNSPIETALDNRWRGLTYEGFDDLFKKDKESFKALYPDMYEHLTNPEIQKTAGKISPYAQTGIGEFIADTYAELIKGTKLSDDVMALYKKYNGPIPGVG